MAILIDAPEVTSGSYMMTQDSTGRVAWMSNYIVADTSGLAAYTGQATRVSISDGTSYTYSSGSTATIDGISVVAATGKGSGRWLIVSENGIYAYRYPSLQAALDAGAALGCPIRLRPNETINVTTPLTFVVAKTRLIGFQSKLIDNTLTTGAMLLMTGSGTGNPYSNTGGGIEGVFFEKTNTGAGINVTAILVDTATEAGTSHTDITGCNVRGFQIGIQFKRNAYIMKVANTDFLACGVGIDVVNAENNGERILFFNTNVYNSTLGYRNNCSTSDVNFDSSSLDYNIKQMELSGGSKTWFKVLHMEGKNYASPPVTTEGDGTSLYVHGGWFVCTELTTRPTSMFSINATGNALCKVQDVFINNCGTTLGRFKTGTGRFLISGTGCYATMENQQHTCDEANVFMDGSFALSSTTIIDPWVAIGTGPNSSTSSYSQTNAELSVSSMYAHSGSNSMRYYKQFGAGSESAFRIFLPIPAASFISFDYWIRKPAGSATGTISVTFQWGAGHQIGLNGLPEMAHLETYGSENITLTTANMDWTQKGLFGVPAPGWASWFCVTFNGASFNSIGESVFFDDFTLTAW